MMRLLAILFAFGCVSIPAYAGTLSLPRLEAAIESGQLGSIMGVVVERGGTIIYERYFGKGGRDVLTDVRSAGKSITALAVGAAIAEQKLSGTDVRIWPALGSADRNEHAEITLRDLLTMSSRLDCNDWDDASPGNEERMYERRDWRTFALSVPLAPSYTRDPDGFGRFSYCTAGVFLIGQLIESATGKTFDAYVAERIFAPLGITAVEWKRSPSGEVQSGGQISMRAVDLARIGRMVLNGGEYEGRRILPDAWVKSMLTPHRRATAVDDYGYLWWVRAFRSGETSVTGWYMFGNGGNKVVVLPALDTVVVLTTTNYNMPTAHQATTDIVERAVMPALLAGARSD